MCALVLSYVNEDGKSESKQVYNNVLLDSTDMVSPWHPHLPHLLSSLSQVCPDIFKMLISPILQTPSDPAVC